MKKSLPKLNRTAADFLSSEEGAISEKQEARVSTFLTLSGGDGGVLPARVSGWA